MKKLALTFVVTVLFALSAFTAKAEAYWVHTGWPCPQYGLLIPNGAGAYGCWYWNGALRWFYWAE